MYTAVQYYSDYPEEKTVIGNSVFKYRYFKNPKSEKTLVLLTGGIGFSDLFYMHFNRFAKDFSVITFDYPIEYPTIGSLADAVSELLKSLGIKAWLVGQSLGGVVAQVIAYKHPEIVEGLVLSNTACLSGEMSTEARKFLMKMLKTEERLKPIVRIMPFGIYKKMCTGVLRKMAGKNLNGEERLIIDEMCRLTDRLMNRPYEYHMIDFLCDSINYQEMTKNDFMKWEGKIMLILSEDDDTFSNAVKDSLIAQMPNPTVVSDLGGGHLTMIIHPDEYIGTVTEFIKNN